MNRHTRWRHLSKPNRERVILAACFFGLVVWALGVKFL